MEKDARVTPSVSSDAPPTDALYSSSFDDASPVTSTSVGSRSNSVEPVPPKPPAVAPRKILLQVSKKRERPAPAADSAAGSHSRQPSAERRGASTGEAEPLVDVDKRTSPSPPSTFEDRLRERVAAALSVRGPGEAPLPAADVGAVAREVALAVADLGPEAGSVARTLVPHLRDPENFALREQVRTRRLPASQLVRMSDLELVNPELKARTLAATDHRMKELNTRAIVESTAAPTDLYPCESCGKRRCVMVQVERAKTWFSGGGEEQLAILCYCVECGHGFRPQ